MLPGPYRQVDPAGSKAAEATSDSAANARTRSDALRRGMLALDRRALADAARADRIGPAWRERPMTLVDAARLVSRDFVAAADRAALLRPEASDVERAVQRYEGVLRSGRERGDQRWREMGFLRQVMHITGAWRDSPLMIGEDGERLALERLAELGTRWNGLAKRVAEANKAAVLALEQVKPAAAAELAERRERAAVAREIMDERNHQDVVRQLQRERGQTRDHGTEW